MTETEPPGTVESSEPLPQHNDVGKSKSATIWVNTSKLKTFKNTVKLQGLSLSDEFNTFLERRTAELKGLTTISNPDSADGRAERQQAYESAKKRVFELHLDILKMIKFFREQGTLRSFLEVFCKTYIDYDKKFDFESYGYEGEKAYETYCIEFIESASDREAEFKRETARFLLRNRNIDFVYDEIAFVEKLHEKRRLGKQMIQYQMDMLSPEELSQLQEQERAREEVDQQKKEAGRKAKEEAERKRKEQEAKEREEDDRSLDEEDDEEEAEDDTEEEDDDDMGSVVDPNVPTIERIIEEEKKEKEDSAEEATDEKVMPQPSSKCWAIVPVGGE